LSLLTLLECGAKAEPIGARMMFVLSSECIVAKREITIPAAIPFRCFSSANFRIAGDTGVISNSARPGVALPVSSESHHS